MYIPISTKFSLSHLAAYFWFAISVVLSIPWLSELSSVVGFYLAFIIIAGIGYIPGYINTFNVVSLLLDKQPKVKNENPKKSVSVVVACRNEGYQIYNTLTYIKNQDYQGIIKLIIVDNNSTDNTTEQALKAIKELEIENAQVLFEPNNGKFNALNHALNFIDTEYYITIDADTLLHKSAIKRLVARIENQIIPKHGKKEIYAVAGTVLAKNSRENFLTKLQEWDYFLGIASIKRMQGLYQGTLVAQGAFSLYDTQAIKDIGGYPDAIGEDILITWRMLQENQKVYFEPLAIAFTEVPNSLKHFAKQRSRWARGMIEALKEIKPWKQPIWYVKFLTGINLIMPFLDVVYTFCWIPGLILAMFGHFYIIGPMTLLVLPLAIIQNYILYSHQVKVFKTNNLIIRKNKIGFLFYMLFYQIIMSPISVYGYIQEFLSLRRTWK